MGKRHRLLWLILALCLQGAAVLWMVGRYELILRLGTEVRLPCRAYDPRDPFRGRYLRMSVEKSLSLPPGGEYSSWEQSPPYARLVPDGTDARGLTLYRVAEVASSPGAEGLWMQCLRCRIGYSFFSQEEREKQTTVTAILDFPDQFFLPEKFAARAEKLFTQGDGDGVAVYKVLGGRGVLCDVEVSGLSLLSRLKDEE